MSAASATHARVPRSRQPALRIVSPTLPPTLVFLAFSESSPRAQAALDTLYRTYKESCLAFIRAWRPAYSSDDADELLQEFVAQRIEKQDLVRAWDPARTRFRTWLLSALRHFLLNRRRRDARHEARLVAMADLEGFDPAHGETPEVLYTRAFARIVIGRALDALRAEQVGRRELFERLEPHLDMSPPPYAELSREFGRTVGGLQQEMVKLRKSWRRVLRHEVAQIACEAQVDDELRAFLAALESHEPT